MNYFIYISQQKYSRIGAQEYVPFEQDELSIRNIKDACQKHFGPQIEKDLVCDVLAGERGPSCNKMAQIPNKKVFFVRFVKPEGELDEEEENRNREVSVLIITSECQVQVLHVSVGDVQTSKLTTNIIHDIS